MGDEKPYAAAAQNARRRGRAWGPRGRTADTAMRTLWTAAPVARVLGRGGAASASTSARGGEDLAGRDGTIDEDAPSFDAGAPRVGRVDAWRELGFSSAREMREQHGSDLHRHNRRRLRAGRAPVTEAEFLRKNEDGDLSSISGSDSDATDSDATDSDEDGSASVSRHASFRASRNAGEGAQMVVEGEDGSIFGVWRCLVAPPGRDVDDAAARDALATLQRIKDSASKPWVVILARGGHFAASAFEPGKFFFPKENGKGDDEKGAGETMTNPSRSNASERFLNELVPASAAAAHKTFHRYVVRAKAGGRQSGKDGGGKTIKSAGSSIRRANEAALEKEIRDLFLNDGRWASIVASAALIFVSASKTDERTLFVGADAPLRRDDARVRRVPFATKRPTFNETRRVVGKLGLVNFDVVREEADVVRDEETKRATQTSTLTSAQFARLEAAKARAAEAAAALGSFVVGTSEGEVEAEVEVEADAGRPALSKKEKEKLKKKRAKERAREKAAEENAAKTSAEETTTLSISSPSPDFRPASSSGGGKGGKAAALLAKARQNQSAKRDEAVRDRPRLFFFSLRRRLGASFFFPVFSRFSPAAFAIAIDD